MKRLWRRFVRKKVAVIVSSLQKMVEELLELTAELEEEEKNIRVEIQNLEGERFKVLQESAGANKVAAKLRDLLQQ